jgi:hypothetical protein
MPQAQSISAPKRLPLVIRPDNRDSTLNKDARLVNCYVESTDPDNQEYWIYKRPGLTFNAVFASNQAGQGIYNWLGDIYSVFNGTLYKNGVSLGAVNASGQYRWKETLGSAAKLVLNNGNAAYYSTGSGAPTAIASNYPSPSIKGWAYLDSTLYVGDTKNNLLGSNLNDPTTWQVTNTIAAQIESDNNIVIDKQLVYVVAAKNWSTEFFYDAGNATGSPLGPVQGAKVNFGCIHADSMVAIDSVLFYLCRGRDGPAQVVQIENAKPTIVSTKQVERLLKGSVGTNTIYAFAVRIPGHKFYVLTNKTLNLTLVYDMSDKRWHQWTDTNGNYWPFVASTQDSSGNIILQAEANGELFTFDNSSTTDAGPLITAEVYTPSYDGNTRHQKTMTSIEFICDEQTGSFLLVRHNDFDYDPTRWTSFRRVELWQDRPILPQGGTFRRRAYHFRHQSATPFRLQAVDLQMDIGTF